MIKYSPNESRKLFLASESILTRFEPDSTQDALASPQDLRSPE